MQFSRSLYALRVFKNANRLLSTAPSVPPRKSPLITLSNDVKMPQVGLGTWQSSPDEVKTAVKAAIEAGYRLIDTAAVYENETAIGEVLKELVYDGKIIRADMFITTKVWVTHLHPDDIMSSVRESLRQLQTDYVDLLLAHMPTCFNGEMTAQNRNVAVEDTWRGLERVYKRGLTRAIGVSNYSGKQIERVQKTAKIPIHNCQVELHVYWPQHELHDICKRYNIALTSYATLGSPGRASFMPNQFGWKDAPSALEDKNVIELAKKYEKTPAQILLRYAMDRGIAIIPKSVNPSRIVENFELFDFQLNRKEIAKLESSKHRQRLFMNEFMKGHPEDPFAAERER
uniref:Aldo keto reductase domain containing protein n=2 Tax=Haemonchus contortus TaxID=6289 RepID=A0A7I4Y0C3_HAECO